MIPRGLASALRLAAGLRPLLVATDFDGVLAPLESDPMAVKPTPGTIEVLRALAEVPDVHVAVVSGRDLTTLARLSGIHESEPIALIASHGAESTSEAVRQAMEAARITPEDRVRLAQLAEDVALLVEERHPDAGIEHKTAAVVVHTRGLPKELADAALADARSVALAHEGIRVLKGKSVLELSVSPADKGSALTAYGRHVGAQARIYLGDDATDEDVFARLTRPDDVTIKVGDGSTAARHRVADEADVAETLHLLAQLLLGR
ncbi:MAG TPA: trehalose-phosphatase [Intrasporangium sp.]|uniref:trehalose-phosphatase n=1 Tax=Intrasporangium sp. TaxID=1925024 RepID=UPI002D7686F9|nr:trehalose-phosphatase [Intrasporangium sp.]HET7396991.1 trehalose-phosphatase [Intrasporangium sp.]